MSNHTPDGYGSSPDHGNSEQWSASDAEASADPYAGSAQNPPDYPPPLGQQPPGGQPSGHEQSYSADDGSGDARNRITLNFWLSVFFTWIPALIFYLTEQDKSSRAMEFHKANLNFSLLRLFVGLFMIIPFVGWVLGGIAAIVLFVMHIMAAINAPKEYDQGAPTYKFPFNIPLIK